MIYGARRWRNVSVDCDATVQDLYDELKGSANLPDGPAVKINGIDANFTTVLKNCDEVEFHKASGQKG